jgi:hypothetical protein
MTSELLTASPLAWKPCNSLAVVCAGAQCVCSVMMVACLYGRVGQAQDEKCQVRNSMKRD